MTEQPPRVRPRAKRERQPNSKQAANWEKVDESGSGTRGKEVCNTSPLVIQGIKLDVTNMRCRRKLPQEKASKKTPPNQKMKKLTEKQCWTR